MPDLSARGRASVLPPGHQLLQRVLHQALLAGEPLFDLNHLRPIHRAAINLVQFSNDLPLKPTIERWCNLGQAAQPDRFASEADQPVDYRAATTDLISETNSVQVAPRRVSRPPIRQ